MHFLEFDSMLLTRHEVLYQFDGISLGIRANVLVLCYANINVCEKAEIAAVLALKRIHKMWAFVPETFTGVQYSNSEIKQNI